MKLAHLALPVTLLVATSAAAEEPRATPPGPVAVAAPPAAVTPAGSAAPAAAPASAAPAAAPTNAAPAVGAPAMGRDAPAGSVPPSSVRERSALNDIFFEAFGSGLLYSLNYERIIPKLHVGLRAGASYFTYAVSSYGKSGNLTLASFPLLASYYLGWRSHNLQLGLGATILYTGAASDSQGTKFDAERSGVGLSASAVVGYRYMPRDGGVSFGVGFTPLLRSSKFLPWGGANVGYAF